MTYHRFSLFILAALASAGIVSAQTKATTAKPDSTLKKQENSFFKGFSPADPTSEFFQFRQGLFDNFRDFKSRILDHYADFLEGEWHEYEPLAPLKRKDRPKPEIVPSTKDAAPIDNGHIGDPKVNKTRLSKTMKTNTLKKNTNAIFNPSAKGYKVVIKGQQVPAPKPAQVVAEKGSEETPAPSDTVSHPQEQVIPEVAEVVADSVAVPEVAEVVADTVAVPEVAEVVAPTPVTIPPTVGFMQSLEDREGKDVVNFYNMEILVPSLDFTILEKTNNVADLGYQWRKLDEQGVNNLFNENVRPIIDGMGLSDYLAYQFLIDYVDAKFPQCGATPKVGLVHYLLANMGCDVRLGLTRGGDPLVMMNCSQTIYEVPRLQIGGSIYNVYAPTNGDISGGVITCELPQSSSYGNQMNFALSSLNLPVNERPYDISLGKIHIKGTVNQNIYPLLYRYPQMDTGDYAASDVLPDVKHDVARQVREQLAGMDPLDATNELLHFVQDAFSYATDRDLHGFEKPYFFEENLYYPTNDCEDRAIFYTYLLWNALDLESHLLAFPEHESASVSLTSDRLYGTSYSLDGKKFYISDPTYIGANTGQCMPTYENVSPEIDFVYPEELPKMTDEEPSSELN